MPEPVFGLTAGAAKLVGAMADDYRARLPSTGNVPRHVDTPGERNDFLILNLSGEEIPAFACVDLVPQDSPFGNLLTAREVGTPVPTYFGYKPYTPRIGAPTCAQRKFAFNGSASIGIGKTGRVTRATGKPLRCLLDPALNWTNASNQYNANAWRKNLAPVPGTWFLGCGVGYRFGGADPADPTQGFVVEHELFEPHCRMPAVPRCIKLVVPAMSCSDPHSISAPGGTFHMACCDAMDETCDECLEWEDRTSATNYATALLVPSESVDNCTCKLLIYYFYDNGTETLQSTWAAPLNWQELFNGDVGDTLDVEPVVMQVSDGMTSGTCTSPGGSWPTTATIEVEAFGACDDVCDSFVPDGTCADAMLFVATNDSSIGDNLIWSPPGPGATCGANADGPCAPLDPYDVCGCPTDYGDTCEVNCVPIHTTDPDDLYVPPDPAPDCPPPLETPDGCYCGLNRALPGIPSLCLFQAQIVPGVGGFGTYQVWRKINDCPPVNTVTAIHGASACESLCECEDAEDVYGPADAAGIETGSLVWTPCRCPDEGCPVESEFGTCEYQYLSGFWEYSTDTCIEGYFCGGGNPTNPDPEEGEFGYVECTPDP